MDQKVGVYHGVELARYHFGDAHPFGPARHDRFVAEMDRTGLSERVGHFSPKLANPSQIALFHSPEYVNQVRSKSKLGVGYLDRGDTPAIKGIFEAASFVVGSVLDAVEQMMANHIQCAFVPIAGLHHARREQAAGFCVFNDCGVAIEQLKRHYGLKTILYVDIDAHHGDGVYDAFQADPQVIIVDFHEDGRFLYPGTGDADETGCGAAKGTKLNLPMNPGAGDTAFFTAWEQAEAFIAQYPPEFIILQCGADSIAGDPITHLEFSPAVHQHAAYRLCQIANQYGHGRLLACGGGGYNLENIGKAWNAVVQAMVNATTC